jgi:hypothetical protein
LPKRSRFAADRQPFPSGRTIDRDHICAVEKPSKPVGFERHEEKLRQG